MKKKLTKKLKKYMGLIVFIIGVLLWGFTLPQALFEKLHVLYYYASILGSISIFFGLFTIIWNA